MAFDVECKVWLKKDGRPVLDEVKARLLSAIEMKGSISDAAEACGISYRYAWGTVRELEAALGVKLVRSTRGGGTRGSTALTPEGWALLEEFANKKRRIDEQLAHLFKNPTLTTDGAVLVGDKIVLIRRGRDPAKGRYALPGGFVEYGERLEDGVVREVFEETGLRTEVLDLVGMYSDPGRDPRGHIVSAVFLLRAVGGALKAGDDAADIALFDLDALPELAFDHAHIIADLQLMLGRKFR